MALRLLKPVAPILGRNARVVHFAGNNLQRLAVEYELVAFNPDTMRGDGIDLWRCGNMLRKREPADLRTSFEASIVALLIFSTRTSVALGDNKRVLRDLRSFMVRDLIARKRPPRGILLC